MTMASTFTEMTPSPIFFDVVLFLLLSLVAGPSFMSISLLLVELWQFSFIRDGPEIWNSEIHSSQICPISGDSGKWGIPYMPRMFLKNIIQCYKIPAFAVCKLLREKPQGGRITSLVPRLGLTGESVMPTETLPCEVFISTCAFKSDGFSSNDLSLFLFFLSITFVSFDIRN